MRVLGVSALSHDAAVAVIDDGTLVFAGHSERYSRQKNDERLNAGILAEMNGASNHRILRTTVERLREVISPFGVEPASVLFIAMFTHLQRFEAMGRGHDRASMHGSPFTDREWRTIGPWQIEKKEACATAFYRHVYDEQFGVSELLMSAVLLERWLEDFGCHFAFTLVRDVLGKDGVSDYPEYTSQMRDHHYIGGVSGWSATSFRSLVNHADDTGPGQHPLERSHREYAIDHLLPKLRQITRPESC